MSDAHAPPGEVSPADRRRSPRFRIVQRCLARPDRQDPADRPQGWRCIAWDVSATGVGVALPFRPAVGTRLVVEPWRLPGAGPVLTRVVHSLPLEHLWMCGCELAVPLTETELRAWVAGGRVPWPAVPPEDAVAGIEVG